VNGKLKMKNAKTESRAARYVLLIFNF